MFYCVLRRLGSSRLFCFVCLNKLQPAFSCSSANVRNWWETIQAESLPHRDVKEMRIRLLGLFLPTKFIKSLTTLEFSFLDITR